MKNAVVENEVLRSINSFFSEIRQGVGNLLRFKSQISPFVTIRNPAGAAKLPLGQKASVIPKMIPKRRSLFTSKKSHSWGIKEPHVTLEPQVADPWVRLSWSNIGW